MSENTGSQPLDVSQMRKIKETIDPLLRMMNQDELNEYAAFVLRVTERYGSENHGEEWRNHNE